MSKGFGFITFGNRDGFIGATKQQQHVLEGSTVRFSFWAHGRGILLLSVCVPNVCAFMELVGTCGPAGMRVLGLGFLCRVKEWWTVTLAFSLVA